MEETLKQLAKEIITPKFAAIKQSCGRALNVLQNEETLQATETWKLRELCLEPLQMALESRAKKLSYYALAGIQHIIKDERFHSSLESGVEGHWLPVQVLSTLHMTPQLPEDIQVDIMKLLLHMTLTTAWCMNAGIVIKISQLLWRCSTESPKKTRRVAAAMFRESLGEWCALALGGASTPDSILSLLTYLRQNSSEENASEDENSNDVDGSGTSAEVYIDTYRDSMPGVRAPVQAALTQMLTNFVETLREIEDKVVEDGDDMLADFKASVGPGNVESAMEEVVTLLRYLVNQLETAQSNGSRQTLPLLLEGVAAILNKMPTMVRHNLSFQDLVWKQLCPVLISLLGVPRVEKVEREREPVLASSNTLGSATKIIYSIAAELVRLVGSLKSLRPVLESLFHRILLYPPPQQRLDALKVIRELLSDPERIVDLAIPSDDKSTNKTELTDMALIKLIMDAVQEGSHCTDLSVCLVSVTCVDGLLRSLDTLCAGQLISDSVADDILAACAKLSKGQTLDSRSAGDECSRGGQQDGDGGSVSVSSGQQLSSLSPPDSPRPVIDSDSNSESSGADVVKRVSRMRMSDVEAQDDQGPDAHASEASGAGPASQAHTTTPGETTPPPLPPSPPETEAGDGGNEEDKGKDSPAEETRKATPPPAEETRKTTPVEQQFSPARKALREECERVERLNAGEFVGLLRSVAPQLLSLPDISDVDDALQTFASNFCTGLCQQQNSSGKSEMAGLVLNADGVYTASIAALKLSYALSKNAFYTTKQHHLLPQSQVQFVDGVLGSGLLLYLSPTWLSELYTQTVTAPLMEVTHLAMADSALLQMLENVDGLGSHEVGGQMMYEFRRDEEEPDSASEETPEMQLKIEAGQTLARCILLTCWDGVLDVLSVLLDGKSSCGITFSLGLLLGTEGAREETQRGRDAICLSLNGLQTASRLCCMLGLQSKCASAFAQLASASCVREDPRAATLGSVTEVKGSLKAAVLREKGGGAVRLHAATVLSMDVMMTTGLEVASHAADCWKHAFRCCAHISELEHTYFSRGNHESSLPRVHQGKASDAEGAGDTDGMLEMEPVLTTGAVPVAPRINVAELIRQSCMESGWDSSLTGGSILTPPQAARALCGLSQEVDSLFEDAASKLNLKALLSFLTELGQASRQQLRHLQLQHHDSSDATNMLTPGVAGGQGGGGGGQGSRLPTNALHLYRLQQALMTVVHSPRPLLHLVRVWSAASPYLVEATGHRDSSISKMAVTCIHDFIVAVLANRHELPHFHINEFLCKTFEDMLCLELCDSDVQDQIVCSICELVEACMEELQSGWRPLFGALRSVRIEHTANEKVNEARQRHVAAVLDVFEVYLNTDNILVFANATVDCILCLLKYVHGSGMFEDVDDDDDGSDSGSDVGAGGLNLQNLCVPALGYLSRCCAVLASMWKMPACPVFKGARRIQLGTHVRTVDPNIPHMDVPLVLESFLPTGGSKSAENANSRTDYAADSLSLTSVDSGVLEAESEREDKRTAGWLKTGYPSLAELDKGSGVLQVWYLLLDGLATAISSCPRSFQPQTLTTLFQLLRDTAVVPGVKFSLHCVNHLLLPMLQSWLHRGSRLHGYWDSGALNFKQCCGLTADLVVEFIAKFVGQPEEEASLELMLKQLFAVLTECVAQPIENLSLLGCSCIRHVMLTAGPVLTEAMWTISAGCLSHAVSVTTHNLRLLMSLFHPDSDNFYGDVGQVKVATRKDCVAMDNMRLKQLARQVFLLESQVTSMPQLQFDMEEDKSFVFLIYPPDHADSLNPDHITARVPLRDMVVGLLANQLLLQTLGSLLLNSSADTDPTTQQSLPGLMRYMSTRVVLHLMSILEGLYQMSVDFDVRPGLKFLLQKVAGLEVAANLYRLAGASTVLYLHATTHLCCRLDNLDTESVRKLLAQEKKEEKEERRGGREDGQEETSREGQHVTASNCTQPSSSSSSAAREESSTGVAGNRQKNQSHSVGTRAEESTNSEKKPQEKASGSSAQPTGSTQNNPSSGNPTSSQLPGNVITTTTTPTNPQITPAATGTTKTHSINPQTATVSKTTVNPTQIPPSTSTTTTSSSPPPPLPRWKQRGLSSLASPVQSADVFVPMLKARCDALCRQYVQVVVGGSQTQSLVDRMQGRPLFFLLAQPEDMAAVTQPLLAAAPPSGKGWTTPRATTKDSAGQPALVPCGLVSTAVSSPQMMHDNTWSKETAPQDSLVSTAVSSPKMMNAVEEGGALHPTSTESSPTETDHPDNKDAGYRDDDNKDTDHHDSKDSDHQDKKDTDQLDNKNEGHHDNKEVPRNGDESGRQFSKRQLRADHESKVYSVATDTVIQNLIGQYKRHKMHSTMPNTQVHFARHHRLPPAKVKVPRKEPVDEVIDKQQQSSIMKDSEARQRSWSEMLGTVLSLFLTLTDAQFTALLPAVSPCVTHLICHAHDPALRDTLAQWFQRLGKMYGFMPPGEEEEEK